MISGHDFIVFSDDWGRHPFSCQHIMKHLLPQNRILWVNTIGLRNPRLSIYDIKRSFEKIRRWLSPGQTSLAALPENLTIINPFMTPYNNIGAVRFLNQRIVIDSVRSAIQKLKFHNPISVATVPNAGDYVRNFGESVVVYNCVDDFTQWPDADERLVGEMENCLLDKADLILASARELCHKKRRQGKIPVLLPHGVDIDHFLDSPVSPEATKAFHGLPRPLIGFFGAISPWLDFKLISDIAKLRPGWSFVLLGPADTDVTMLHNLPNVHLPGKISYAELPGYAAAFDVALIPFLINELTVSVNPLKLLEYLACGLPVVSTPLPEVQQFDQFVTLASDANSFVRAIEHALRKDSNEEKIRRMKIAQRYSWAAIAEKFGEHIQMTLDRTKDCSMTT